MKALIKTSVLFILIAVFLYGLFSWFIRHQISHHFKVQLDQQKQYVVIGNSHPECALNDSLAVHMSNWALSGENMYYGSIKMKKILADNPHVKCVAIEWSPNQFGSHMKNWILEDTYMEKEARALSFLFTSEQSLELLKAAPITFCRSWLLADQKYMAQWSTQTELRTDAFNWGGFKALKKSKVDSLIQDPHFKKGELEMIPCELNLRATRDWVNQMKASGVRVIFFRCPIHPEYGRNYEEQYQRLFKEWFPDFELLDFQDSTFPNDCFFDLEHLNEKGANRFTPIFDSIIRKKFELSLQ